MRFYRSELPHKTRRGKTPDSGGSAYGGLITLYVACIPEAFSGRAAIESPSPYVNDFSILNQAEFFKDWPASIYLGGGTEETPADAPESEPADIRRAVHLLRANGVAPDQFVR
jgi:predicted alpha/beta superfamily hydrolase